MCSNMLASRHQPNRPRRARRRPAVVQIALLTLLPASLPAGPLPQDQGPASYVRALELLSVGDSLAAIELLRATTESEPDFGPGFLRLGSVLSARAGERASEFEVRLEAKRALARALDLMPGDPEALFEYGLLLRGQLLRGDAERVLRRAMEAADERGHAFSPELEGRLHFALGRIYETWWEDWRDLVTIPPTAQPLSCSRLYDPAPHEYAAVFCPEAWAEQLPGLVSISELKADEQERMLWHYRRAWEADPTRVDAAVRLLGQLADAGYWAEYLDAAGRAVAQATADPRSHLFLGLGLHEVGQDLAADSAFDRALRLLPAAEQAVFSDISSLIKESAQEYYGTLDEAGRERAARIFFAATDPLYLTWAEERRLEHYARLAWAELRFGDPTLGARGWESERGQIWIRYGRPWRSYQCCYGSESRTEYWSYGPEGPVFTFTRLRTYQHARLTEAAKFVADELAGVAPEAYRPRSITAILGFPHQLVRFRGEDPDLVRVEVYAEPPLDSLEFPSGSDLELGFFLLDPGHREIFASRFPASVNAPRFALTYRIQLEAGRYRYGLEARRKGPEGQARPACRERDTLVAQRFPRDRLSVSDLLLADELEPLAERPAAKADVRILPSRRLHFEPGRPIHVYFEVYGLEADSVGLASYEVEFAVEDAEQRNLVDRIVRGFVELFRREAEEEPRVSWQRLVPVTGDMTVDYLSVSLPPLDAGEYVMRLRIADLASGDRAERTRRMWIDAPP